MHDSSHKEGDLYQCTCSKCGYKREGLVDWHTPNTACPECRGSYYAEKAYVTFQIKANVIQPEWSVKLIKGESQV